MTHFLSFARNFKLLALICMLSVASINVSANTETNNESRIIGGSNAASGAYPWMTAIHSAGNLGPFCGGALIDRRYVLTAAHCLFDKDGNRLTANNINVTVGQYQISTADTNEQTIAISEILLHESYSFTDRNFKNDIALLRLQNDVTNITPIPLAANLNGLATGDLLKVMGWGTTIENVDSSSSDTLLEVDVPYVSLAKCRESYNGLDSSQVCAGDITNGGVDSCQGDSGGPLVRNVNGNLQILGIVSFGNGCGQIGFPGVYTNVAHFNTTTNWINDTISRRNGEISLDTDNSSGGGGGGFIDMHLLLTLFASLLFLRRKN